MRWFLAAVATAGCAAMAAQFGAVPVLPALCYLAMIAVALSAIDVVEHRLPDEMTLPSYPVVVGLLAIPRDWERLEFALLGLAGAWAIYTLLAVIYRSGIGWGDVKLSGVLGLYLGWFGLRVFLVGLLAGFALAAVTGVALVAARRATWKTQLPYGPFMFAGVLAAVLIWG